MTKREFPKAIISLKAESPGHGEWGWVRSGAQLAPERGRGCHGPPVALGTAPWPGPAPPSLGGTPTLRPLPPHRMGDGSGKAEEGTHHPTQAALLGWLYLHDKPGKNAQ